MRHFASATYDVDCVEVGGLLLKNWAVSRYQASNSTLLWGAL
ncbi:MAG: hypothetical protein ACYTG0_26930 [Planctomycetota bacterium]|jgi:hypothetical protein